MVKVSSTPKTGQPRAVVSRHLNDRDAAGSVSSAVIDERPDTLAERTFRAAGRIEEVAGLVRDAVGRRNDSDSPGGCLM